jgi:hypothetical protein
MQNKGLVIATIMHNELSDLHYSAKKSLENLDEVNSPRVHRERLAHNHIGWMKDIDEVWHGRQFSRHN